MSDLCQRCGRAPRDITHVCPPPELSFTNVSPPAVGAGGACSQHGVYVGHYCVQCRRNATLAALRQNAWEATQYMTPDEVRSYVDAVMREVESDQP